MKRIRDDVYAGSQFKRTFGSSRGDSYAQSQPPSGGGGGGGGGGAGGAISQTLTTSDALTYLKEVKNMFQDQKEKYDTFLEVMKDFKAQRTDTIGVIARVKELFKGHNNLILGFNTFLPKGYEITLDEDESLPKKTVEFEEAISFVNKIKKRFQNDEHIYKSFLDILNMYRKEHKDINEVYNEVAALLDDHQDLLVEFRRFLPDSSAMPSTHVSYGRNSFQTLHERNSATPNFRKMHMDKQRSRRDTFTTSLADHDPSINHFELDDGKVMMNLQKEQRSHTEKENRDRTIRYQDVRDAEHDNRDFKLQHFTEKRKLGRSVEGCGGNTNFSAHDEKDALKTMYNQGFVFCEKVKERLGSSDDYQAFLKCLNIYNNGIIKRNDLQNLVTDLLGKYPDLMNEFNDFLERSENIDGFLAGVMNKKSLGSDDHLPGSVGIEDKDKEQKREAEGRKEKERYREKYIPKSIQELDLSNCERSTPSYRRLPDNYRIHAENQKTELGAEVLNDHWVSVTSGSEDYSFNFMRKNQYEESLFRCEDDRYELDMLLESVRSTVKQAEDLLDDVNENKINVVTPFRIEAYFTAINLRCVERLYGDHGLDVMDILRRNPGLALPVILIRLKQKQEEWARCRTDFNKVWAEIYAKNLYKSLDHRSFYFKQQDIKNLSTKSLVYEIKELKETKQKEDDVLLAIGAKNRQPIVPHLECEYSDLSIHEDLYKLVRYSCEEIFSTKEQSNKAMGFWTTFLEPMLGVHSRTHVPKVTEDSGNDRHHASNNMAYVGENGVGSSGDTLVNNSKQLKSLGDQDENALQEPWLFPMGDNLSKGGIVDEEHNPRDDPVCNTHQEKEQKNIDVTDKVKGSNKQITSSELVASSNASFAIGADRCQSRSSLEETGCDASASKSNDIVREANNAKANVAPLEAGDVAKQIYVRNGNVVSVSHDKSKLEKEEGEFSPNGDSDDDFFPRGGTVLKERPKSKTNSDIKQYQSGNGEEVHCQVADVEDEVSENVSDAGEDVSVSDSEGEECSREEHEEEEEDGENEDKAESEGEAEGISDAHFLVDGTLLPLSERSLLSVKPLAKNVLAITADKERKNSRVFYGNDDFYALFRLHRVLYERILSARTNSTGAEMKWRTSKDPGSSNPYARFLSALYSLLDGSADNAKFEDECRAIIGNQSYILFTLDKLIYKLVKQLHSVATDEMDIKLLQLYEYEKSRKAGELIDSVYFDNVHVLLHEENIYRFECKCAPSQLSIQLMDNVKEKPEVFAVSIDPNFATYLYNDYLSVFSGKKEPQGIALRRNKRKYADLDESSALFKAMEGVQVANGLECKIACISSKISYVLDTEDSFIRLRRKKDSLSGRYASHDQLRVDRFHGFLSAS